MRPEHGQDALAWTGRLCVLDSIMDNPEPRPDRGGQGTSSSQQLTPELRALVDARVEEQVQELLNNRAPEPLWKIDDVAAYLNVSKRTVENLITDGSIRPLWIRGARRFHADAIEAYLRTTASTRS